MAEIEEVWADRNPTAYVEACIREGIDPKTLDPYLFEQYRAERAFYDRPLIVEDLSIQRDEVEPERSENSDYWESVARIILPRFPRGKVTKKELLGRLRGIRELGFPLERGYSGLKSRELWNYVVDVKREVWAEAEEHCPDVARSIKRLNEDRTRFRDGRW